ncbi:hypothetical protein [Nocardia sp. NPDC049149]|uniref:hypothetical protein n=1 Tax=Nocardia sp. NPDC049149 TaxID=3364315 RepID=UPI00371974E4
MFHGSLASFAVYQPNSLDNQHRFWETDLRGESYASMLNLFAAVHLRSVRLVQRTRHRSRTDEPWWPHINTAATGLKVKINRFQSITGDSAGNVGPRSPIAFGGYVAGDMYADLFGGVVGIRKDCRASGFSALE